MSSGPRCGGTAQLGGWQAVLGGGSVASEARAGVEVVLACVSQGNGTRGCDTMDCTGMPRGRDAVGSAVPQWDKQ